MAGEMGTRATDDLIERVVLGDDLAALSAAQRAQYYQEVCESFIRLQGKLELYARRDAALFRGEAREA